MKRWTLKALLASSAMCLALAAMAQAGEWVAGDFHQHTTYTDGGNPLATVMDKNDKFGLDWWANSEHGGKFTRDAAGPVLTSNYDTGEYARFWDDKSAYPALTFLGDYAGTSGGHTNMWRWQCIRDYSFQDVLVAREIHEKPIVQAVEWNVPGHEHCGVGIIADQFGHWRRHHGHPGWSKPDASPVAEFEYLFDANDTDMAGGLSQGWVGKNTLNNHGKAVAAAAWLQANYPTTSWMVIAHPERKGAGDPNYIGSGSKGYNIEHFRDLNNAAPDVCFGFESMPGHQKEGQRGGYGSSAIGGGTFGGCGAYAAKVGGLWDAMLGEGRHWWLFANSDFHNTVNDFWPGEYQKNYTYVAHKQNPQAIVDGLRSGNTFVVEGDLIDALNFTAEFGCGRATMGQTLPLKVKKGHCNRVKITIWFRSPELNNNNTPVAVDHIDLIAGDVTGFKTPGTADYTKATNESTKVIARFTADDWKVEKHGWCVIHYCMPVDHSMYFRLRGTNMPPNTPNETDADGNPLSDTLMGANTAEKAWADLWFYSNPIFVRVQN